MQTETIMKKAVQKKQVAQNKTDEQPLVVSKIAAAIKATVQQRERKRSENLSEREAFIKRLAF